MRLFVVDPHPIFRRGLTASLGLMDEVETVADAAGPREARLRAELAASDVVVVDCAAPGGLDFIGTVRGTTAAVVLVCSADTRDVTVVRALREGAAGYVAKDALTHEALQSTLAAMASGASVIGAGLMQRMMAVSGDDGELVRRPLPALAEREQAVLSLIAEGLPTREIALELAYSERTVKNVLHDVVTKLGVRSRSQAVAHAVREGLI